MAVVITGDKALIAKLEAFRRLDVFARGFDDMGRTVAATAKALAPKHSGRLANSIRPKVRANQSQLKTVVQAGARLGTTQAPIIHYGQYQNRKAQPFLTNALAVANSGYVEIRLDTAMENQMRAVGL